LLGGSGGGGGDEAEVEPQDGVPLRGPLPFPQAISLGLSCAVDGSRAALSRPSDAWKPLTAATLVVAVSLDGAGFYAASQFLRPGDNAGMISTLVSKVLTVAVDGAWVFVAPVVAVAVVQQVLPLLGEKILFDALKATAGLEEDEAEEQEGEVNTTVPSASPSLPSASLRAIRAARVQELEESDGLGLRSFGVAASRARSLAGLGLAAVPIGIGLSFVLPVVGSVAATGLATTIAAYTLAWELLDPYFDKANMGFEEQEKLVWSNRFVLTAGSDPWCLFTTPCDRLLFGHTTLTVKARDVHSCHSHTSEGHPREHLNTRPSEVTLRRRRVKPRVSRLTLVDGVRVAVRRRVGCAASGAAVGGGGAGGGGRAGVAGAGTRAGREAGRVAGRRWEGGIGSQPQT
jgi:hypothetical protein